MKIYDANGMCWIWDSQLCTLCMLGSNPNDGQQFDSLEQAVKWLNDNGYMEE